MTTIPPHHSTTPEQELPRVLEALHAVFQPPLTPTPDSNIQSQQADRYLISFQRTTVAWPVCDRLLLNPQRTHFYTHFFAAQTLVAKCRADVLQLREGDLPGLRDSLMAHLLKFCQGGNNGDGKGAIVTQLAMALCALAVQMEWTSLLTDLLSEYSTGNGGVSGGVVPSAAMEGGKMHLALEMCQLLPEETTSHRLLPLKGENQRDCFLTVLQSSARMVLDFFGFCISSSLNRQSSGVVGVGDANELKIRESTLRCLNSWIRNVDIPPKLLEVSPLVNWAFEIVNSGSVVDGGGDMFELAVDVVVELLRCFSSQVEGNMGLVHKMVPLLMKISTPSLPATNTQQPPDSAFHMALETEDEDGMRAFCRIYTEMGEAYMSLIMSHENLNQQALVELVLACSAIPDHDIANITLNFWYRFVTTIEMVSPYEYRQLQIDNFLPQLTRLVSTCTTTLLRYPSDMDSLPPDLLDDVHRHRSYVSDTIEDCCRLLGGAEVLGNVRGSLRTEYEKLQSGGDGALTTGWHGVEACLFALIGASRYAPRDEDLVMPFAMSIIPNLITTTTAAHGNGGTTPLTMVRTPPLCNTINSFIGAYSSWLDQHPPHLEQILPLLSTTMSDGRCASSAAITVRNLCESCRSPGSAHCLSGDIAVRWYEEIVRRSLLVDLRDELEVLEGVCVAVTRYLEAAGGGEEGAGVYLSRIMGPIGRRLAALTTGELGECATPRQIAAELERMTVIVRFFDVYDDTSNSTNNGTTYSNGRGENTQLPSAARSQFIVNLATLSWDFLEAASQRHPIDVHLAEKLCRLHKHLLRRCGPKPYRQRLLPLRSHLVGAYKRSHLSPYLYMASICIADFSSPKASSSSGSSSSNSSSSGNGGTVSITSTEAAEYAQCEAILLDMFQELSEITFSFLRSPEDFQSHPDVIEELFFLASKMTQCCPKSFVGKFDLLHPYVRCAIAGMDLDHKDANRGTMNFLETVVGCGLTLRDSLDSSSNCSSSNGMTALTECKDSLERIIMIEGKNIVIKLLQALSGNLPCYRITANDNSGSIAGILYKLNQLLSPGMLLSWVTEALAVVEQQLTSLPLKGVDHNERSKLLESITGSSSLCSSQNEFFDSVRNFAHLCDRRRRMGRR